MEQAFAYYICQGTTGPNFDISPYHNKRRLILMHHPYLSPAKENTRHQRPIPTQSIPLNHASHKSAHIKNQKSPNKPTLLPPTSNLPWASNPTPNDSPLPAVPPSRKSTPPARHRSRHADSPPRPPDRMDPLPLPLPLPLPPPPLLPRPPKPPRVPNQPRQTMRQQQPERQHRDHGAETGPLGRRRGWWVRGGRGGRLEEGGEEGDGDGEEGEAEGAVEEEVGGCCCYCCCWGGWLGRWRGHWLWMSEKGVGGRWRLRRDGKGVG